VLGVTQVNNVFIFPGVGLGALAAGARCVTEGMFMAAARELATMDGEGGTLLPPITRLRDIALRIATAVARQAVAEGVATDDGRSLSDDAIAATMWVARYA
jgi:malate dehydrogenase (oxaloacetate-decarboxylating)